MQMERKRKRQDSEKGVDNLDLDDKVKIHKLFQKKFEFSNPDDAPWEMPVLKLGSDWSIPELMQMKKELNDVKSLLNRKELYGWHEHTKFTNIAGNIISEVQQEIHPELCTQAWCKFYEILSSYPVVKCGSKELVSVHLCEAPGGFVTSLNHFLTLKGFSGQWHWKATTLNPYHEGNELGHMIDDDRLIRHTMDNWYFGTDGTGNLMCRSNMHGLCQLMDKIGNVLLVTADGSIDCQSKPGEQENVVSRLHFCEVITALQLLCPGGTFVLKMFTMLECRAISLMYLLNCAFRKVHVVKPGTSKGGNSEVYLVCLDFLHKFSEGFIESLCDYYFGTDDPAACFDLDQIPTSFLNRHQECCRSFQNLQCDTIRRNLDLHRELSDVERLHIHCQKVYCAEYFIQLYDLKPIPRECRILWNTKSQVRRPNTKKKSHNSQNSSSAGKLLGTFEERNTTSLLPWKQRVFQIKTYQSSEDEEPYVTVEKGNRRLYASDVIQGVWSTVQGKPYSTIHSSRFCDEFLLSQVHLLLANVQWLSDQALHDNKEKLAEAAQQLATVLMEVCSAPPPQLEGMIEEGGYVPGEITETEGPGPDIALVPAGEPTPLYVKVKEILKGKPWACSVMDEMDDTENTVMYYDIPKESVDLKWEVLDQQEFLNIVHHVLVSTPRGSNVAIGLHTVLTRYMAGLVYILFQHFTKVLFVPVPGSTFLKQHLLCVDFLGAKEFMLNYLDAVKATHDSEPCKTGQSAILETVPVQVLLSDYAFVNFLKKSNTVLLKKFITDVVDAEQKKYSSEISTSSDSVYIEQNLLSAGTSIKNTGNDDKLLGDLGTDRTLISNQDSPITNEQNTCSEQADTSHMCSQLTEEQTTCSRLSEEEEMCSKPHR